MTNDEAKLARQALEIIELAFQAGSRGRDILQQLRDDHELDLSSATLDAWDDFTAAADTLNTEIIDLHDALETEETALGVDSGGGAKGGN